MQELTLGKIYKNGIQYSGTTDAATNINYDNSKGAIRAGNVQGAIDEIMETTSQSRTLTQAEYDALPDTKYTDGIEYFITDAEPLDASTIAYDNTASKMTATNVQAGIDELNSNINDSIQWKLVGSTTGTSQIAIPSDAKEIYVEVTRGTSTEIVYDFCIPIISLTNVEKLFYRQYWTGSNAYHSGVIRATNKYVLINRVLSNNNTDIASTSTITLYYR